MESDEDFLDSYGNVIDPAERVPTSQNSKPSKDIPDKKPLPSPFLPSDVAKGKGKVGTIYESNVLEKKRLMYPPPEYKDLDSMPESTGFSSGVASKPEDHEIDFLALEPKHSILDQFEQAKLLGLMEKFLSPKFDAATMNDSTHQENKIYHSLRLLIKEEQEEFRSFTRSLFFKEAFVKRLSVLKPDVRRYVEECYEHRLSLVRLYPKIFEPYFQNTDSMVRLLPQETKNQYEMRFELTLVELGSISKIVLLPKHRFADPNLPKISVSTKYDVIAGKVPPKPPTSNQKTLNKLPVSQDPNAELLAQRTNPTVVISMSALKCLFDNFGPTFDRVWEIPFIVRVYPNGSRVVFVDKPLPPKKLSAQDKNAWFIKVASKCFILQGWNQSKPTPCNEDQELVSDSIEDIFADAVDTGIIDDLETFGTSNETSHTKPVSKFGGQVDGADTDSSGDDELQINENESHSDPQDEHAESPLPVRRSRRLSAKSKPEKVVPNTQRKVKPVQTADTSLNKGDEQLANEKPAETQKLDKSSKPDTLTGILKDLKAYKRRNSSQKNVLDDIMSAQKDFLKKDSHVKVAGATVLDIQGAMSEYTGEFLKRTAIGQEKEYCPPPLGKNVAYRLWNIWNKSNPIQSNLKVLIRSSTHGVRKEGIPITGVKGPLMQRYTLSSKLEYLTQFGASVLTRSEIAREWIATLVRPDSALVRARIDALTYNVFLNERKALKHLTREGASVDFRPGEQLGVLHTIFDSLKAIAEPGQYLMRHDGKTGAFVRVFKASKGGQTSQNHYNLHENYEVNASEDADQNIQFNPIDVNKVTPLHLRLKRVPGLFSPRPLKGGPGKGRGRGKNKKRGGSRGRGKGRGK